MRCRRTVHYNHSSLSPWTLLGLGLMAVAAFFLVLPLFLAAVAVLGVVIVYFTWRVRRTLRQMEKALAEHREAGAESEDGCTIIDITPPPDPSRQTASRSD